MVGDFGYSRFKATARGAKLRALVEGFSAEIAILAKHGLPPAKAVNETLVAFEAAEGLLTDSEKRFLGRMVYEVLGVDTWEVVSRKGVGGVLDSGTTFKRRSTKLISIRRKDPRPGGDEHPIRSPGGYQLVPPGLKPNERTKVANAVFVPTLEDALPHLDKGFHIRMGRKGIRPSFIAKGSLIIS